MKPFLTHTYIGVLSTILLLFTSCEKVKTENTVPTKKPNFLIVIADDAGWNDMSFHGSEIKTPTIDALANNGIQLERFYVNPTCSPTRASLLTGMPASRMGIVAPISGRSEKTLPDSIATLPQMLQKAGYQTALMGKWHLGLQPKSGPKAYGFDYSYGFLHGQIDQYSHHYKNGDPSWYRQGKLIEEQGHATDLITKEAIDWLQQRDTTKNFFLQVAYSAPHIPLQEPEKWTSQYEFIQNKSRRNYAAAMAHMDASFGEIIDELKKSNQLENTIILFMSDNGAQENWYPTTQYDGKYGPNDSLGSNFPLKDFKKSNYEGAIRVPAIVYWKNHFKNHKNNNYIAVTDIMPTFIDFAAANLPNNVEGISIKNMLNSKEVNNHAIYVRGHLQESYIEKPWKLIRTRHLNAATEFELYNIETDATETENVITTHPEITEHLKKQLETEFNKDSPNVNVPLK